MNRPKPGEIYRHFKGSLYQIIGVAKHSETGEAEVVYQALYGDFGLYVRPLEMFVSPVDAKKYPQYAGQMRFQKVERKSGENVSQKEAPAGTADVEEQRDETSASGFLLEFLDQDTPKEKLDLLDKRRTALTDFELDSIAAAMELQLDGRNAEEKTDCLKWKLRTLSRYERARRNS